jgi:hypothetical protein
MADAADKTPAAAAAAPTVGAKIAATAAATGSVDAPAPKMVEGVVARGRTVLAPTDECEVVGYKDDGTPRFRFKDKPYGPGEKVSLPEAEIAHLRRTGFLVDPDLKVVDVATGPTLTNVPG